MSYSIVAHGATVNDALASLSDKFDREVIGRHPEHSHDRGLVIASAQAALALIGPDPAPIEGDPIDVEVAISGSLSGQWESNGQGGTTLAQRDDGTRHVHGLSMSIRVDRHRRIGA